jgi:hypothetical protein
MNYILCIQDKRPLLTRAIENAEKAINFDLTRYDPQNDYFCGFALAQVVFEAGEDAEKCETRLKAKNLFCPLCFQLAKRPVSCGEELCTALICGRCFTKALGQEWARIRNPYNNFSTLKLTDIDPSAVQVRCPACQVYVDPMTVRSCTSKLLPLTAGQIESYDSVRVRCQYCPISIAMTPTECYEHEAKKCTRRPVACPVLGCEIKLPLPQLIARHIPGCITREYALKMSCDHTRRPRVPYILALGHRKLWNHMNVFEDYPPTSPNCFADDVSTAEVEASWYWAREIYKWFESKTLTLGEMRHHAPLRIRADSAGLVSRYRDSMEVSLAVIESLAQDVNPVLHEIIEGPPNESPQKKRTRYTKEDVENVPAQIMHLLANPDHVQPRFGAVSVSHSQTSSQFETDLDPLSARILAKPTLRALGLRRAQLPVAFHADPIDFGYGRGTGDAVLAAGAAAAHEAAANADNASEHTSDTASVDGTVDSWAAYLNEPINPQTYHTRASEAEATRIESLQAFGARLQYMNTVGYTDPNAPRGPLDAGHVTLHNGTLRAGDANLADDDDDDAHSHISVSSDSHISITSDDSNANATVSSVQPLVTIPPPPAPSMEYVSSPEDLEDQSDALTSASSSFTPFMRYHTMNDLSSSLEQTRMIIAGPSAAESIVIEGPSPIEYVAAFRRAHDAANARALGEAPSSLSFSHADSPASLPSSALQQNAPSSSSSSSTTTSTSAAAPTDSASAITIAVRDSLLAFLRQDGSDSDSE